MRIVDDFLEGVDKKPLVHVGASQTPRLLVIHYSVTDTVAQAVTTLNERKLSYHVLVEKTGKAFQTRPFTKTAAHPGRSNWKANGGVTAGATVQVGSIGICLMNKGFAFGSSPSAPGKLIYNPADASMQRWEIFPDAQIQACRTIAAAVIAAYPIAEVVGHHDIAIMGKFDPGPLFDFAPLNASVPRPIDLGFKTKVKAGRTAKLRRTAAADGTPIRDLAAGATVHVRSIAYGPKAQSLRPDPPNAPRHLTRWASVDIDGSNAHAGFVDMKELAATPLDPALAAFL